MSEHLTTHTRVAAAPAQVLYGLVAETARWPVIFEPTVHVRILERMGATERVQLWAIVGDEVKTWTSRRVLDAAALRISFRQERSQHPIASMGGSWEFHELADGGTEVVLHHDFTAVDESSAGGLAAAVDANSERELAALGRVAELHHQIDELVFSFEDTVRLPGPADDAYSFIERSDRWPDRLPHVDRVALTEDKPGIQDMEMDTVTADGATHTTRSIRLCTPGKRIVYKQLVPPALLIGHSGAWEFTGDGDGTLVTARHTVAINPAAIAAILGPENGIVEARAYLRKALGANSRATLTHAAHVRDHQRPAVNS